MDHHRHPVRLPDRHALRNPCTISGTVTGDGRTYEFTAVPGSATTPRRARLVEYGLGLECPAPDDGTHLHGVDLRLTGMPRSASVTFSRLANW